MPGTVTFTVAADVAKAVDGVLKIVAAQGKAVDGFKKTKNAAKNAKTEVEGIHGALGPIGGKLEEIAKGAASFATGFASFEGVKALIQQVAEAIEHAREEFVKLREEAKQGLSLSGFQNSEAYVKRTLSLSARYGIPKEKVAGVRGEIASRTAGNPAYTDADRAALEEQSLQYQEVTGSDAVDAFHAAYALKQSYNLTTAGAFRQVEFLRKHGVSPQDQASLLPKMLTTATDVGLSTDDFSALMAMVAASGGEQSKVGKGLIEGFTEKVPELVQQGRLKKGEPLPAMLADLLKFHDEDPDAYNKALGHRAAGAFYSVASHPEVLQQAYADEHGFAADPVGDLVRHMEADPGYQKTRAINQKRQVAANVDAGATSPETLDWWDRHETRATYLYSKLPAPIRFHWLAEAAAYNESIRRDTAIGRIVSPWAGPGVAMGGEFVHGFSHDDPLLHKGQKMIDAQTGEGGGGPADRLHAAATKLDAAADKSLHAAELQLRASQSQGRDRTSRS